MGINFLFTLTILVFYQGHNQSVQSIKVRKVDNGLSNYFTHSVFFDNHGVVWIEPPDDVVLDYSHSDTTCPRTTYDTKSLDNSCDEKPSVNNLEPGIWTEFIEEIVLSCSQDPFQEDVDSLALQSHQSARKDLLAGDLELLIRIFLVQSLDSTAARHLSLETKLLDEINVKAKNTLLRGNYLVKIDFQKTGNKENAPDRAALTSAHPYWYKQSVIVLVIVLMVLGLFAGLIYRKRALRIGNVRFHARPKYELSNMNKEASIITLRKVQNYLEETKSYLNPDLSIQDIAEATDIHKRYISQAINENLNQGFPFFINSYRIEEVKRRLQDPEYKKYTLVAIAESCGLKSKSTFNRTFKKITGQTPSEYLCINHPDLK